MKNFFEFQKQARKKSNSVLVMFGLMLVILLFLYNLCVVYGINFYNFGVLSDQSSWFIVEDKNLKIQFGLLALFSIGFLFAYFNQLWTYRSEPLSVVYELGGVSLNDRSTPLEAKERQLLNVVEEMCIASGIPVVPVYVLKSEVSINAFTGGHDFKTAYIVVTQGALDELTREEIQAVVAHEVGHIVSADVSVNSVLLSCITALTFLVTMGFKMMEVMGRTQSRSRTSKGDGVGVLFAVAALLIVFGSLGAFFGKLLQSLFSRKREFLADSLGVQFTRNPSALAKALAKIRDLSLCGEIRKASAMNISHMCIVSPLSKGFFSEMMSSHPPIDLRIKLLDSKYLDPMATKKLKTPNKTQSDFSLKSNVRDEHQSYVIDESNILKGLLVGEPYLSEVLAQQKLSEIQQIDTDDQLHDNVDFKYAVWGLLMSQNLQIQQQQIGLLKNLYQQAFNPDKLPKIQNDKISKSDLGTSILSLVIPKFKNLDLNQKQLFIKSLKQLMSVDPIFSEFEKIILASFIVASVDKKVDFKLNHLNLKKLISLFVNLNISDENQKLISYRQALKSFYDKDFDSESKILDQFSFDELILMMHKIRTSSVQFKQQICRSLLTAIQHDLEISIQEVEAFRAFSIAIGIPSPPVV